MGLTPFVQVEPLGLLTAGLVIGFSRDMAGGRVLQLRTATLRMTFLHDFQSLSLWVSSSFSLLIKAYTFSSR